ncbi:hypothetical protein DD236_10075 [Ancrocorticia populi]|uniref:Uncharacterized protein n=1 Tax=Ancrocorticia populi TaxID=2175228 RepID=A0A2V1K8H6_9ACTO|nr:hypothetical protein DD236_10075 [Ancrocorticia populi]
MKTLKRFATLILGIGALVSLGMCTLVPISDMRSAGSPAVACIEIGGTPNGVSEMTVPDAEWRMLPPSVVCEWPTETGQFITTVEPLTPFSFPLLLGVQVAFLMAIYLQRRLRKPTGTDT